MTNELKVEKTISKPSAEVFRAIGEGRLFLNCSGRNETLKVDFRVGGEYRLEFAGHDKYNHGKFLEIIENKKIVFTWCQDPTLSLTPDTTVTIVLQDAGKSTHLTLTHVGFKDQVVCDMHRGGWTGGLNDLANEITEGTLKITRKFKTSVQKLFETCKNPALFFGMLGDAAKTQVDFKVGGRFLVPVKNGEVSGTFSEIVPNQKIVFSWTSTGCQTENTKVSLLFEADEGEISWLELVHEGLLTEAQQKSHRAGWDWLLHELMTKHST